MKNKNIVVLMGGPSTEREVSLNTGKAILDALLEKGYRAVGVEIDPPRLVEQLREQNCDIVFNAMHGMYGEDGRLQGALELSGIAYTGSGVLASAIAINKATTKQMFIAAGITTPRSKTYRKREGSAVIIDDILKDFSTPLVVKSLSQGSSIGVTIVEDPSELKSAIEDSFAYDEEILVEEFIKGKELTVAVWGNEKPEALPIIEITTRSGRYDYRSKYTKGESEHLVPAPLSDEVTKRVQDMAVRAFVALSCCGVARVDFMLSEDEIPYALEVNTVPGMTSTSLVPDAGRAAGIEFPDMCERILQMAINK